MQIILSMPGMGPVLGAEFLAVIGDTRNFRDADHLAAFARPSAGAARVRPQSQALVPS